MDWLERVAKASPTSKNSKKHQGDKEAKLTKAEVSEQTKEETVEEKRMSEWLGSFSHWTLEEIMFGPPWSVQMQSMLEQMTLWWNCKDTFGLSSEDFQVHLIRYKLAIDMIIARSRDFEEQVVGVAIAVALVAALV